ncbi:MAG TPA: serine/threonine-protein kinase [Gammaproteobacteria bacterium]|nr:serine/threonine-protein kinase [Gammaproteobacteria bacterium]
MPRIKRTSSEIRRAALLGIAVAALAHLAPFDVIPRLDGVVFDAFANHLPPDEAGIVVIDPTQPGALAALASASAVTIVSPSAFAIGSVASSAPGEAAAWLLAVGALIALLATRTRHHRNAWLVMLATPVLLLAGSGTAFAAAGAWIPVAGPALLAFATGAAAAVAMRPTPKPSFKAETEPETARELLRRGELIEAWHVYREMPPTDSLLAELYDLGQALAAAGYPELAVDTYMRVALVDPEYEDVAARLVSIGRPDAFADRETRERLKAEMPATLGRYRLLEPIGQGTTGRVYLARDPRINRLVAVKLIDLTLERDEGEVADAKDRFRREAETTGRLSHRNIVTVYDMGQSKGRAYIAMEYLKGDLMSRFTAVGNLLPPRLVLQLGALAADALDYAHSQNVIHRDIKPGNIMYDSVSGDLKITDFGIARLIDVNRTRTGVVLGTPSFMAPEQIEGGNVKGHTDLFALGVTLYELLTGQLPFRGNSMTKLMFVIVNEPHEAVSAVRPTLPIEVDAIIDRALLKDPTARYQRGADMAADLRAAARMMA